MFGYVKINKPELKIKEYELYRGLYCSLCKSMGKNFGLLSRLTLSYDITFLVLTRLSFTLSVPEFKSGRCPFNPSKRCNYCLNADEELKYAASVAMMLFYFKVKDNIDDSSFFKRLLCYLILPYAFFKYKKAKKLYPEIASEIFKSMNRQRLNELKRTSSSDLAAHESAHSLGKILSFGLKDDEGNIYRFGYGVGKFVYLCDAVEDIESDIKNKSYNPFVVKYKLKSKPDEEVKAEIESTVNLSAAIVSEAYNKIENKTMQSLIENIIYEGMENTMNKVLKGKEKK